MKKSFHGLFRQPPSIRPAGFLVYPALVLALLWSPLCSAQNGNESHTSSNGKKGKNNNQPVHATADHAELRPNGTSILTGNVHILRNGQTLNSDKVIYNQPQNLIRIPNQGTYRNSFMQVMGRNGTFDLNKNRGSFEQARYQFLHRKGRGKAKRVELQGMNHSTLTRATYTTCPPAHRAWVLKGSKVKINKARGEGSARNVTVDFMGVPFLYTPYISFPVTNKRKSGFLVPSVGVSGKTGFDLTLPFYLNLAPNYDATLTPRIMSSRGVMLGGQFRYLTQAMHGNVEAQYLPYDFKAKKRRDLFSVKHQGLLSQHLGADINYTHVSDDRYFNDLGSNLGVTSRAALLQQGRLAYQRGNWITLRGRVEGYQVLDQNPLTRGNPYDRLPQLRLDTQTPARWHGLRLSLNADFTNFYSHTKRVVGTRTNFDPAISYENDQGAWFLRSKASYERTDYRLHQTAPGERKHPSRGLPIFDVDTGMRLERTAWHGWIQTVEPRLYYLYVPYRNQSDLPVFDTGLPDFTFPELFQRNLFTGLDRVENANQTTAAVTSRFIDPKTGEQRLSVSLGDIYRFANPRVSLPLTSSTPAIYQKSSYKPHNNASDVVGDVQYQFTHDWYAGLSTQYDPHSARFDRNRVSLQYRSPNSGLLNLDYRFRRGLLRQTDFSFLWPMTSHWSLVGRWNYSLRDHRNIEIMGGVEYDACCYAVRAAFRRYVTTHYTDQGYYRGQNMNNAFYIQLQLKGLTRFGNRIGALLRRDILGYSSQEDTP